MDEKEIINSDIEMTEVQEEITVDEIMPVIEVTEVEGYDIEMQEAFPALTSDPGYNHALLNNREINDAHPISAITGLRAELNAIEALQTVYSDKKGNADYYEWANGHYIGQYGVGYFVTLNKDVQTIDICTGDNIFGVVVDSAAFIGGQDDVARDGHYGLVATSGAVHVRCELDVAEGNYVTSNAYGIATKTTSNCGYRVVAIHDIGGVPHATIQLNISADQIDSIGAELQDLDDRVDTNYKNIISATNVANQAYNKANEIDISNREMSNKVDIAVGKVNDMVIDVENMGAQVSNSASMSAQAKAIAESATLVATVAKNEADKALTETSDLRKEFEDKAMEFDVKLQNASSDMNAAKEALELNQKKLQDSVDGAVKDFEELEKDLEPLATWSDAENPIGIAGFVARADKDSVTLASMVEWKGDAGESLAGFVQEATEENATVKAVASYKRKDADGNAIEPGGAAGLIAQVDANQAVVQTVAALDGGIAGLEAKVKDNTSSLTLLASQTIGDYIIVETWSETDKDTSKIYYTKNTKDYYYYKNNKWNQTKNTHDAGLDGAIAGVQSAADANKAELDALASYQAKDEDGNPIYSVAGIMAHVGKNSAEVSQLATYSFTDADGNPVDGAAGLMAQVDENKSEISAVANRSFTKADGTVVTGLAGLDAQVDENKSNVSLVANRVAGKYTVIPEYPKGDESQIAKLDKDKIYHSDTSTYWYHNGTTWVSINTFKAFAKVYDLDETMVYYAGGSYRKYLYYESGWKSTSNSYEAGLSASISGVQVVADEHSSAINSLTSWQGETNISMARIEQKADANGAYIQSTVSNMDKYSVGPYSQAYGFTLEQAGGVLELGMIYAPTEAHEEKYEYADGEDIKTYTRSFTPQYLYMWGKLNEQYRWITVDKNYTETSETNTSAKAVYFTTTEPAVSGNFGYWYTNGKTITSTTGTYEPYTLYKWSSYTDQNGDEKYHWVAVATLAGNSQNRAVSQVRQEANSVVAEVTNARGDAASLGLRITNTESEVQSIASWTKDKDGEQYNLATIQQTANDASASISQVVEAVGEDGKVNAASIVAAVNGSDSSVVINADHIKFEGFVSFASKDDVKDVQDNAVYDTKVEYALSSSATEFAAVDGDEGKWSTTAPEWRTDAYVWQQTTIIKGDESVTSTQTCIQGAKGKDGQDGNDGQTPYVKNGNWWIGNADTGVKAEGVDGDTPTVEINDDGYWVIDGTQTSIKALGSDGVDAPKVVSEEKQFHISTSNETAPDKDSEDWATTPVNYDKDKYLWTRSVYTMDDDSVIKGDAYLDKNFTTISRWCKDNNEAYIDGANIYAGSVTADQIDTAGLRADLIEVKDENDNVIFKADAQNNDVYASSLSAISANLGTVTAGEIQSPNYTEPKIKVWDDEPIVGSMGLTFTSNGDGTCSVSGIGTCTDTDLVIPEVSPDGDNVTSIGSRAFYNCGSLTSVAISNSVTTIGSRAFFGCFSLTSITIPDSVTSIGDYAFDTCSNLTGIYISDIVAWCNISFYDEYTNPLYYAHNLYLNGKLVTDLVVPSTVTEIKSSTFVCCRSLTNVTIPNSVTSIGHDAFWACKNLTSVTIGNGVTSIGEYAFHNCENLSVVYYCATAEDWGNITVESKNDALNTTTLYYYSNEKPTEEGNFWYYDRGSGFKISCTDKNMIDSKYFKVTQGGDVTATSGEISGWTFDENLLTANDKKVGLYSGEDYLVNSLVDSETQSPTRFFCGTLDELAKTIQPVFCVLADGSLYATAARFYGEHVVIAKDVSVESPSGNKIPIGAIGSFITGAQVRQMIGEAVGSIFDPNQYTWYDGGNGDISIKITRNSDHLPTFPMHIKLSNSTKIIKTIELQLSQNIQFALAYNLVDGNGYRMPYKTITYDTNTCVVKIDIDANQVCQEVYVEIYYMYNNTKYSPCLKYSGTQVADGAIQVTTTDK